MSKKPGSVLMGDLQNWKVDYYWHGSKIETEVEGQEFSINLNGRNSDIRAAHRQIAELLGRQPSGQGHGAKRSKVHAKEKVTARRESLDAEVADLESQIKRSIEMPQDLNFPRGIAAKFAAGIISVAKARGLTNRMTNPQKREFAKEYDRLTGGISRSAS